jgi:hypothetical protein
MHTFVFSLSIRCEIMRREGVVESKFPLDLFFPQRGCRMRKVGRRIFVPNRKITMFLSAEPVHLGVQVFRFFLPQGEKI